MVQFAIFVLHPEMYRAKRILCLYTRLSLFLVHVFIRGDTKTREQNMIFPSLSHEIPAFFQGYTKYPLSLSHPVESVKLLCHSPILYYNFPSVQLYFRKTYSPLLPLGFGILKLLLVPGEGLGMLLNPFGMPGEGIGTEF